MKLSSLCFFAVGVSATCYGVVLALGLGCASLASPAVEEDAVHVLRNKADLIHDAEKAAHPDAGADAAR